MSILKTVNLMICWVAYSGKNRKNNQILVHLYEKYKNRNVEFIGISFDRNKHSWESVIKADRLIWPQY
ncbi:thioredoxin-like domain-containing protein [Pedobacter sp. KLB.chiD]|uniref:thioredoxin-like domain-containing protein n=1 Tax=Pedobacter sp. KLB.chiD TaxID=3387402 RepID=UPI0039995BEB